jgi:nucleoid-associated protein YgaU
VAREVAMKRDVKVGLFVAAVVCGVAAILLGGGLSARTPGQIPALRLDSGAPEAVALAPEDERSASVPDDLTETIEPPAEADLDESDAFAADIDASGEQFSDDSEWAAAEATDNALAAGGISADRFDRPAEPVLHDDTTAETPESRDAAQPSAGGGPRPSPEEVDAIEVAEFDPVIPVEVAGAEDATEDVKKCFYVIKEGESFWTITKKLYGAGKYYASVVNANPDVAPKSVRAGQVIRVPIIEGAPLREELLATAEELAPRSRRSRIYLARDVLHVIRSGETLGDIAQTYYKSAIKWRHILVANPSLDPKRLRAGKEITVPALTEVPGAPKLSKVSSPRRAPKPRTPKVYLAADVNIVIKAGDTLQEIAKKYYGKHHKWRHITSDPRNAGIDATRLRPNDKIVVPALTE